MGMKYPATQHHTPEKTDTSIKLSATPSYGERGNNNNNNNNKNAWAVH
jgi:hypothetical protein